jgi:hypothetical protein
MAAKLASAVQRLNLIAPVDWLKRIDQWRRRQPKPSDAVGGDQDACRARARSRGAGREEAEGLIVAAHS